MNLVPEHIDEAIKHMPGMSIDDFWKSLTKLNGKEIAEALSDRVDMREADILDSLLNLVEESKLPFKNVLDIIDNLRFSTTKDKIRHMERLLTAEELYAALFDSLEAEEKDQAIELFRLHTEGE